MCTVSNSWLVYGTCLLFTPSNCLCMDYSSFLAAGAQLDRLSCVRSGTRERWEVGRGDSQRLQPPPKFLLLQFLSSSSMYTCTYFLKVGQVERGISEREEAVVDLGGVRGCKCTPLWQLVMYFCVRNCMSPLMIMQQWHVATTTRHSYTLMHVSVPY